MKTTQTTIDMRLLLDGVVPVAYCGPRRPGVPFDTGLTFRSRKIYLESCGNPEVDTFVAKRMQKFFISHSLLMPGEVE